MNPHRLLIHICTFSLISIKLTGKEIVQYDETENRKQKKKTIALISTEEIAGKTNNQSGICFAVIC